jgi:dipeptidyl aminopeptidase/acylaminoacyl peptidase
MSIHHTSLVPAALLALSFCVVSLGMSAWGDDKAQNLQPTPAGVKSGLIPREVLFGNPDKSSAKISPDGKYLSWLAPRAGVLNVWVAPIDKLDSARPVTDDKKRGIRAYFWAYTGRHILYIQDKDGDEDFHVYGVDLSGDKTTDLTPLKKVRAQIEGVSHKFPKDILIGINDRDARFHDLYKVNLESGAKELVQKNPGFAGFVTDDDFIVRFATKFTPDGGSVYLKPDGKGDWSDFLKIPAADSLTTAVAGFNKTGDAVYLLDSRGRDTSALAMLDLKTGAEKVIAQDPRADAGGVIAHPTEKTIQAVSFTYERTRWEFKDAKVAEDFKQLARVADGDISITGTTLDDRQWVVAFLMDDGPVRYYHYDRPTQKARFLFTNRKSLEGLPLRKMHPRVIKSRDGLDLVCYLTLPPGSDSRNLGKPDQAVPLVLDVHGGPWGRDGWGFDPQHQFLANRGYAVLSVNFRGSTGFGKKFLNAGNREWAGKMHDDLLDAVAWAIKEKIADPAKIAIMGGSYGGYATLVGLTFTPETFACGVDIVGPSNLVTLLSTIPAYWAPALQIFKDRVGDHTTDEGKKFLMERSPLTRADQIRRPLLIGQGANDPRVKQAESDQIVKAMQEKNIPVTYALFTDEGHGFARPENRLAFYAVAEAFLARYLGGRYEAIGDAFVGSSIQVPSGASGIPGLEGKLPRKK